MSAHSTWQDISLYARAVAAGALSIFHYAGAGWQASLAMLGENISALFLRRAKKEAACSTWLFKRPPAQPTLSMASSRLSS